MLQNFTTIRSLGKSSSEDFHGLLLIFELISNQPLYLQARAPLAQSIW